MSFGKFTRQEIIDLISGSWSPYWGGAGGSGTPGGALNSIQFNSASLFSGSSTFTYNTNTNGLYYTGSFFISGAISASYGANTVGFFGTSSWAVSSSRATTSSYAVSSSFAVTASYALNGGTLISFYSGSTLLTSALTSLLITGSGIITTVNGGGVTMSLSASGGSTFNSTGTDQYLARFSGSNGIENGSIYNNRIAKSINSGQHNTMSLVYPISHSHVFGYNNIIDVNGFSNRYSISSLLAGQYNTIIGADASATINKLTSAVGNYDFIQNLYASSAPRATFSGWEAATKTLYAPISGDIEYLFSLGRTSIVVIINKLTNAACIGFSITYPTGPLPTTNKVSVRDNNFEAVDGTPNYNGRGIILGNIKTVNSGFESTNYTNSEIHVFVLDGGDGYYNTYANHAQNIGTSAHGIGTHAEGYYTQTRGVYTHAQNEQSIAAGSGSTASGNKTASGGKYSSANNVFTAAGPSYYFDKLSIFRSTRTYHNFYYDYDNQLVGTGGSGNYDQQITYLVNDLSQTWASYLASNGYSNHQNTLKCIVQIPEVNYIGIVEWFASSISGINRPVTLSDILPDNVGRPSGDEIEYVMIVTALVPGTFMDTYNDIGGGPGYGSFTQGVQTVATGTGSFSGGRRVRTYGNLSFGYGQNISIPHSNAIVFGSIADGNTVQSAASNTFQVIYDSTALFVSKSFVGINTTTAPASFTGLRIANDLRVDQNTELVGNLRVSGSTYLGNELTDRTIVSGSLLVTNYLGVFGNTNISGTLRVTGSQINIGTLTNTGSVNINGDLNVTGFQVIGGNVFLGNQASDIIRVTGSVQMTGSLNVIGPVTANNVFLTGSYNGILTGNVTGSLTGSFIGTGSGNFNGNFIGIYSGSINPGVSFYGSSSYALQALTASYITSSNVFGPYNANSILSSSYSVTSSYSVSSSYAFSASYAVSSSYSVSSSYAFSSSYSLSSSYAISSSFSLLTSNIIGGATNYIPVWSSATSLSSSAAIDNGSIFSINRNTEITGTFANNVPSAINQAQPAVKTNTEGVFCIGSSSVTPTVVAGGIYFDGTNFYLGFA